MIPAEKHRGVQIAAERVSERQWRPVVDGHFYGQRHFLSSRDALAHARRKVDRDAGIRKEPVDVFVADPDAPWMKEIFDRLWAGLWGEGPVLLLNRGTGVAGGPGAKPQVSGSQPPRGPRQHVVASSGSAEDANAALAAFSGHGAAKL